jgi:uncharacterized protein with GYD domain
MPTYILGIKRTQKGLREIGDLTKEMVMGAPKRSEAGGRILHAWATFGRYEVVIVVEFPNDKAALEAINLNRMHGLVTVEVAEAVPLEEFIRALAEPD